MAGRKSVKGAMISARGNINSLALVRSMLSPSKLELIRKSCFGHLFQLQDLQFQGQLYYILLKKLVKSSIDSTRLSFRINGRLIHFGPSDYALMTGLKFSDVSTPPLDSEIYQYVFKAKRFVKFKDIEREFKRECRTTKGDSEMSLKLGLLYVLFGVLLIRHRTSKNIELQYLHLVDDVEQFNMYPWGRVTYDFVVKSTHAARIKMDNMVESGRKIVFDAYGFCYAIQTWAYEVMPKLGEQLAVAIEGADKRLPRMLRWSAPLFFQFDNVNRFFLQSVGEWLAPITPSPEEVEFIELLGGTEYEIQLASLSHPGIVSSRAIADRFTRDELPSQAAKSSEDNVIELVDEAGSDATFVRPRTRRRSQENRPDHAAANCDGANGNSQLLKELISQVKQLQNEVSLLKGKNNCSTDASHMEVDNDRESVNSETTLSDIVGESKGNVADEVCHTASALPTKLKTVWPPNRASGSRNDAGHEPQMRENDVPITMPPAVGAARGTSIPHPYLLCVVHNTRKRSLYG